MNRAEIGGKKLEDGDYAIIDSNEKTTKYHNYFASQLKNYFDDGL